MKEKMLRLSSYAILSDRLKEGGYTLMNGCTGAVDTISDTLAIVLQDAIRSAPGQNKNCYRHESWVSTEHLPDSVTKHLLDQGHLTLVTHDVERAHVAHVASVLHEVAKITPHFLIMPNLNCNYRCVYCFERPIQNKLKSSKTDIGYIHNNVVMQNNQIEAIYNSIEQIRSTTKNQEVWEELVTMGLLDPDVTAGSMITLYGGEPLDKSNKNIVFQIVEEGVKRGFIFSAITNGHDLEHFLPILGKEAISQIQITIDGPKQYHDRSRIACDGTSSFEKIIKNINLALSIDGIEVQIRCHLNHENNNLFGDLLEEFRKQGWVNNPSIIIYASNYHTKNDEGHVAHCISYDNILSLWGNLIAEYNNVYISGVAVHANRLMASMIENSAPLQMKGTYCGANSGLYIFSADGCIYSCWESVGKACSKIGSFSNEKGLILDNKMIEKWFNRSVSTIPECLDCCYALICGGGCAQYSEYNTGQLDKPYCDQFEVVFPAAFSHAMDYHKKGMSVGLQKTGINSDVNMAGT